MKPRIIITMEDGKITDITSDTEVYVHVLDIKNDREFATDVIADKEFVDKLLGKE